MFDLIFKSKIRKEILRLLFSYSGREFYLSEIAKKIHASVGNCQRELDKLVKSNILISQKKNNLKMYFVDKKNPFYKDLKNIIDKTIGIEGEIKKTIKKISGIEFAFIFGSYSKNDFLNSSDIDLFIIGEINENKFLIRIRLLEEKFNREINYHLYSKNEFKKKFKSNSFLQNIIKNYILLTDNQDEFKKLFK